MSDPRDIQGKMLDAYDIPAELRDRWAQIKNRPDGLSQVIGEQTSDHAPVESQYGTVCRTNGYIGEWPE